MHSSGIYRLYIRDKSYIGLSKNIEKQIKKDIKNIKMYLLNKSNAKNPYNLNWLLNFKTLPRINENSYKMALYIVENNLNINDISYEILKTKDFQNEFDLLDDEIFYINKYNSDLDGFNNIKYFNIKLLQFIENNSLDDNPSNNLKYLLEKKANTENKIKKILIEISNNNNQSFLPWIYYSLKEYKIELKHHPKWLDYCDLMLIKYKDWKEKYINN